MAQIKITLTGDEKLIKALKDRRGILKELQKAGEKSAIVVHDRAQTYPPQRPGSTYIRTDRLKLSWAFKVQPYATGVKAFVTNPVEYGPDVMGPKDQAPIHKGRWATTRDVLKEKRKQILGFFDDALIAIRRRLKL